MVESPQDQPDLFYFNGSIEVAEFVKTKLYFITHMRHHQQY